MELLTSFSAVWISCSYLLILCIHCNSAFPNMPFHRLANSSRLKNTQKDQSDVKAPEYEIVQLRILSKRSTNSKDVIRVHLTAFGKDINLHLQRNDDLSDRLDTVKIYEATVTNNGVELKEITTKDDDPGTPYIDPVQMAAVMVRHASDGVLQMDGVIGDDLLIKPATAVANYFEYEGEFSVESGNRSTTYGNNENNGFGNSSPVRNGVHLVFRSLMKTRVSHNVSLGDVVNDINSDHEWTGRKGPLHAWPEVLLMVDYSTYAMHKYYGLDEMQMRRYYISFLNAVDLRFKTLSNPKISLILSQIVIFKSLDATPFPKDPHTDVFDGYKAISDLAHHLYLAKTQQGIYAEFDVAVLLTNLDLCAETFFQCNREILGLGYFMGACNIIHSEELWMGVAIVEDRGAFDGVLTVAHEIGHLLGADHDGEYHFRLDSSFCNPKEGYIMSHGTDSDRKFQWSECSIKQFQFFLNLKRSSCLFNRPSRHNELEESQLPGTVLSLNEQCERIWGTRSCVHDSRVCTSLHCYVFNYGESCVQGYTPAAEGSFCGKDLHCRHGQCVKKSLVYSQAWNMAVWNNRNSLKIGTTLETPVEACTENRDEFFCESYFCTIEHKYACKNSGIIEECCYSFKVLCKDKPLIGSPWLMYFH